MAVNEVEELVLQVFVAGWVVGQAFGDSYGLLVFLESGTSGKCYWLCSSTKTRALVLL